MNTNVTKEELLNNSLPSPPSSPIDYEPSTSRKRAYSISFIQNSETTTVKKKQKFDLNCLKTYLKQDGSSPNTCDKQCHRSLLSWACIGQSVEAIQDLTSLVHLDINLKSGPHHSTALHEACLNGFTQGVEILIGHADIDINAIDHQGQTPLHCATQANKLDCLKILLSAGARLDMTNHQGKLPIHIAIQYGYQSCISLLLSKSTRHNNNPTNIDMIWYKKQVDDYCSIESAIVAGYIGILHTLLNHTTQDKSSTTADLVQVAIDWNRIECLQLLIKKQYPLQQKHLQSTVQQRKIDMVRELSIAGVNPCLSNGQNPSLLYAANHGFLDMIPLVLSLNTSKDCVQQALQLAHHLGLRDSLLQLVVRTLKQKVSSPIKK